MPATTTTWTAATALALLLTVASHADVLNVNQKYQEKDQWCWSATCQSVLEFYGISTTQSNLAEYGTGGANAWNYLAGQGTPGDGIFRRGCDLILANFGTIASSITTTSMPFEVLQSEIASNRPVIINWLWDPPVSGHILLAYGLVNSNVFLMDPWFGPGVYDYDWVCRGSGDIPLHSWSFTLRISTDSTTSNGVPRWWLGSYGFTSNWESASTGDPDFDSAPTDLEYIADTNPTSTTSRLALTITHSDELPAATVISWPSSSNRLYTIQSSGNLSQPSAWTNLTTPAGSNGTGIVMAHTSTLPATPLFFRVKAALKP